MAEVKSRIELFAVYDNKELIRYNVFTARLLVNHAKNKKKYLYDLLAVKKETSRPQQDVW